MISPNCSRVGSNMYKSWIRNNPGLALARVEEFCNEAKAAGMRLHYKESEHYVDIIAARSDDNLYGDYA